VGAGLFQTGAVGYRLRGMAFEYKPGIYKTTKFLPGHEAEIAPNMLVLIRTDGEFAPASVLVPVSNTNNQWRFQMPGVKIPGNSLNWGNTLIKLPHEGFYRLLQELSFGENGRWLKNAIVQLGYTRAGEPILFIAQRRSPLVANDLFFSDKGVKVEMSDIVGPNAMVEALTWYQEPDKKA
jgi:hypothetical protein